MKITDVFFFSNGNLAVCNEEGQQVSDLQQPYLFAIAERLEKAGFDPLLPVYHLPHGDVRLFKTDDGWNWNFLNELRVLPDGENAGAD